MKKRIVYILFCAMISCHSAKHQYINANYLNGDIKSITETSDVRFLSNGEYIEQESNSFPKIKTIKHYSTDNQLSKLVFILDGEMINEVQIETNENGLFKLQEYYNSKNELTKFTKRISDTLVITMTPLGDTLSRSYEYRFSDKISKTITYDYQNKITEIDSVIRNKKGWIIESYHLALLNDDTLNNSVSYYKYPKIDKKGNWVRSMISNNLKFDTVSIKNRVIKYK